MRQKLPAVPVSIKKTPQAAFIKAFSAGSKSFVLPVSVRKYSYFQIII